MRLADLSPFAVDAIARTHGLVEDLDFECPTWDGRVLHIARVETETNVLHEVAHWIAAERVERRMPNYGLGKDPDGGPETHVEDGVTTNGYGSWKEEQSTLVTCALLNAAGLPWGHGARGLLPWMRGERWDEFWYLVGDLWTRGIVANDPLRGLARKGARR